MNTHYFAEEGHYIDIEDLTQIIRSKIIELKQQYSDDEIIEFEENKAWQEIARNIINSYNSDT